MKRPISSNLLAASILVISAITHANQTARAESNLEECIKNSTSWSQCLPGAGGSEEKGYAGFYNFVYAVPNFDSSNIWLKNPVELTH